MCCSTVQIRRPVRFASRRCGMVAGLSLSRTRNGYHRSLPDFLYMLRRSVFKGMRVELSTLYFIPKIEIQLKSISKVWKEEPKEPSATAIDQIRCDRLITLILPSGSVLCSTSRRFYPIVASLGCTINLTGQFELKLIRG
jgi:hypothetical protein